MELLLALAICAILLTGVAVAFHASLDNVEQNQQISTVTQDARMLLNRMMTEARRAIDVNVTANHVSILLPPDGSGVTMTEYYLQNGSLLYRQTVNGSPTVHTVLSPADGVTVNAFTVTAQMGQDSSGMNCTKVMTARLDLRVGDNSFAVTTSMAPRRNQQW